MQYLYVIFLILLLVPAIILLIYSIRWFGELRDPSFTRRHIKGLPRASLLKKAHAAASDKQRFKIFYLQIDRIERQDIAGDFAELGVYKGESAKWMQLMAPERNIHLFDTFDGFPEEDLIGESGKATTYTKADFADTSLDIVKENLGAGNWIFHKGYFPVTTASLKNGLFAFVSLDADLYKPTLAGLRYFFPRMAKGGVILVHDHNKDWPGILKAVGEFSKETAKAYVCFSDPDQTIAFVKD